jgi:hypothetical protein
MKLKRRKSKKAKAAEIAGDYLKLKAAGKAAKGAGKATKGIVAYKGTKGLVKRLPVIAGVGATIGAAFAAAKVIRGGGEEASTT